MADREGEIGQLLDLAVAVAREAGEYLIAGRRGTVTASATKSSPTDVVTEMDTGAEALIRHRLHDQRPTDGLLGEEGEDQPGTSGVRWVIDPIDGTVNYLYDLWHWAVSIGVEQDGRTVAGVVHAPALGVTYTATLGGGAFRDGGAFRNGSRLRCSTVTDLGQTLVATGFGYSAGRREHQAKVLLRVIPQIRDIRRYGAASLDLCAAAEGKVDAYYERGLKPWDLSAGGLIAQEAGLVVGGLGGKPADEDLVVAAPPAIFPALVTLLAQDPAADTDGDFPEPGRVHPE
jgi:myo-inositol-1(or 4)-monophosphatase